MAHNVEALQRKVNRAIYDNPEYNHDMALGLASEWSPVENYDSRIVAWVPSAGLVRFYKLHDIRPPWERP